jgi:hypothetical protein
VSVCTPLLFAWFKKGKGSVEVEYFFIFEEKKHFRKMM